MVYDGSERQRASTTQTRTKLVSPQDSLNIITPVTCSPVFSPFSCVEEDLRHQPSRNKEVLMVLKVPQDCVVSWDPYRYEDSRETFPG